MSKLTNIVSTKEVLTVSQASKVKGGSTDARDTRGAHTNG